MTDCKVARLDELRSILDATLRLGNQIANMKADTQLLGNLPELDSMAVVSLITTLEDHYGFVVADDEISADTFSTLGDLAEFVEQKLRRQIATQP